jgi:hypothetical protein
MSSTLYLGPWAQTYAEWTWVKRVKKDGINTKLLASQLAAERILLVVVIRVGRNLKTYVRFPLYTWCHIVTSYRGWLKF